MSFNHLKIQPGFWIKPVWQYPKHPRRKLTYFVHPSRWSERPYELVTGTGWLPMVAVDVLLDMQGLKLTNLRIELPEIKRWLMVGQIPWQHWWAMTFLMSGVSRWYPRNLNMQCSFIALAQSPASPSIRPKCDDMWNMTLHTFVHLHSR